MRSLEADAAPPDGQILMKDGTYWVPNPAYDKSSWAEFGLSLIGLGADKYLHLDANHNWDNSTTNTSQPAPVPTPAPAPEPAVTGTDSGGWDDAEFDW